MPSETLIDTIYEAALVSERWPAVLDGLAELSGSVGGSLVAYDRSGLPPRIATSPSLAHAAKAFVERGARLHGERLQRGLAARHAGFRREIDFMSAEEIERDAFRHFLRAQGLGWQCASAGAHAGGTTVLVTVERRDDDGPHSDEAVHALDAVRPHILRASTLSTRLALERSQTAVAILQAIGLPAAVLTRERRALAVNALLEKIPAVAAPAAFGRLSLRYPPAQALLNAALLAIGRRAARQTWSIPVPAQPGHEAMIVHLVPLRGAARDIFTGGEALAIFVSVSPGAAPGEEMLSGLYDLTPAEARLARALTEGQTIPGLASALGVSAATLRSQLASIFGKTGTRRQGDLLTLLSGLNAVDIRPA